MSSTVSIGYLGLELSPLLVPYYYDMFKVKTPVCPAGWGCTPRFLKLDPGILNNTNYNGNQLTGHEPFRDVAVVNCCILQSGLDICYIQNLCTDKGKNSHDDWCKTHGPPISIEIPNTLRWPCMHPFFSPKSSKSGIVPSWLHPMCEDHSQAALFESQWRS